MRTKVLVITSNIWKALEHEWFATAINRTRFDVEFALINGEGGELHRFLEKEGIPVHCYAYAGKLSLLPTLFKLRALIKKKKFDIVHAHLFEAGIIGMTAAWWAGVKKRIYTRHYSDFHHSYFLRAVKYDRWINARATHIVAVSNNVKNILVGKEHVSPEKITVIHHGLRLEEFTHVPGSAVDAMKQKYDLGHYPVIGVVSRYIDWKGVQYIIPAFKEIRKLFPDAHLVLANASGSYEKEIKEILTSLPTGSFTEINFENEVNTLYKCFDVFVHAPIDASCEAFGQIYIEAMALEIPCVVTLSGIAIDYVVDGENALVCRYRNSDDIRAGISTVLNNADLTRKITKNARTFVMKHFLFLEKIRKIESLYHGSKHR